VRKVRKVDGGGGRFGGGERVDHCHQQRAESGVTLKMSIEDDPVYRALARRAREVTTAPLSPRCVDGLLLAVRSRGERERVEWWE
jgi:hypothetical protein